MKKFLISKWLHILILGIGLFIIAAVLWVIPQLVNSNLNKQQVVTKYANCNGVNCKPPINVLEFGWPFTAAIYESEVVIDWLNLVLDIGMWILVAMPIVYAFEFWSHQKDKRAGLVR